MSGVGLQACKNLFNNFFGIVWYVLIAQWGAGNLAPRLALMAIAQWGLYDVPHLFGTCPVLVVKCVTGDVSHSELVTSVT